MALGAVGLGAWLLLPPAEIQAPVSGRITLEPASRIVAAAGPTLLTEAEILALNPVRPSVMRLREQPRIFVLAFPDLDMQGAALNRAAALIEKRGQPRDRVLDDRELAAAIAGSGATPATYYYGHNYRASDLLRFFTLAERQGIRLTEQEQWVRAQLALLAPLSLDPGEVAFIAFPGLDSRVDEASRRTILHHEIGHGYFFTNPVFAAHVTRVWRRDFTAADRAAFVGFLTREGYDPQQEEIMVNETMAYLLFTPDERFFSPNQVGLSVQRVEQLRAMLLEAAPSLAGRR